MSDIVERLRQYDDYDAPFHLMHSAADEIERLREALEWYAGDGSTYDGIDVGRRARAALGLEPGRL